MNQSGQQNAGRKGDFPWIPLEKRTVNGRAATLLTGPKSATRSVACGVTTETGKRDSRTSSTGTGPNSPPLSGTEALKERRMTRFFRVRQERERWLHRRSRSNPSVSRGDGALSPVMEGRRLWGEEPVHGGGLWRKFRARGDLSRGPGGGRREKEGTDTVCPCCFDGKM